MTPLASWIIVGGVFVLGVCIGVVFAAWFLDGPMDEYYDDELRD